MFGGLAELLVAPVNAKRMRCFECAFTVSYALWMIRGFVNWKEWLTDEGFHLKPQHLEAMGYPAPWPLLDAWQVSVLGITIAAGVVFLLLGRFRRIGLILLFVTSISVQRIDLMSSSAINKLFIGVFGILALSPGIRKATDGTLMQSVAPTRIIQATLILEYFASGLAKANGDWLQHQDVLWGHVQGVYRTDFAAWALRSFPLWVWTTLQQITLAFELGAPVWFCIRWLRPIAVLIGLGFHFFIAMMMKDLFYFSFQMMTFYLLFLPPTLYTRAQNSYDGILARTGSSAQKEANV